MTIIVSTNQTNLTMPIEFIFWGFIFAYVIHILEEATLAENFVDKVKRNFWPEYSWSKFFGFNTLLIVINITAVVLFDFLRGAWIIFPLSLSMERTLNGLWHLGETVIIKKYSSGLLTSVITWVLMFFIVRYSLLAGQLPYNYFITSLFIGFVITVLMLGSLFVFRIRFRRQL